MDYNPYAWYWTVGGSTTQAYSSKDMAYVPVTDAVYVAWTTRGGVAPRVQSEALLRTELSRYGLYFDLGDYARARSYETRVGGTLVNGVPVKTDPDSLTLINGMATLARDDDALTFDFDTGGTPIHLTAAEAIALSTAVGQWVQSTFSRRAAVLSAIAGGTVTTTADIDAALGA